MNITSIAKFNKIPSTGFVPESSGTAPSSPVVGQLWIDTSVTPKLMKVWDGSAWAPTNLYGGTGASNYTVGNDARLSDQRVPTDGSVTGGTAGAGVKIAAGTITDANVAAANKDGAAGTASMRTLGYTGNAAMPGTARLDQIAAPTAAVSMGSQRITSLAPSSAGTDAVNRNELDAARQGYAGAKEPVRVVATTNVTVATPGATIDGVTMASGDRVLLQGQSTALENGIWIWNGSATPLTRATDADVAGEIKDGTTVAVAAGTGAGTVYIQTASVDTSTPGSGTAQTWVQFTTQATYVGTSNRITVTGTTIDIAATYVGQTSITTLGTITTGTWTGTSIAVANGGTGATTAAAARTNLSAAQAGYQAVLGALTAGTPLTVTHNLNTEKCIAQVRDASTGEYVYPDIIDAPGTPNSLTVTSGINVSASAWEIIITAI